VQWLLLAALGIMWTAFLVPIGRKRSDARSVEDFERRMELLAQAEVHGTGGRWIVTPRKGVRFLGPRERQQARARARRRRILVVLLEAIGLTLLIGVVPPLRAAWIGTAALAGVLIMYVWVLLIVKARSGTAVPVGAQPVAVRRVDPASPTIEPDQHVVVRDAMAAGA
jgi:Flp pilus assembly protein TadB